MKTGASEACTDLHGNGLKQPAAFGEKHLEDMNIIIDGLLANINCFLLTLTHSIPSGKLT